MNNDIPSLKQIREDHEAMNRFRDAAARATVGDEYKGPQTLDHYLEMFACYFVDVVPLPKDESGNELNDEYFEQWKELVRPHIEPWWNAYVLQTLRTGQMQKPLEEIFHEKKIYK